MRGGLQCGSTPASSMRELSDRAKQELARACGLAPWMLDEYLRGERIPAGWIATRIAAAVGVPVEEPLGEVDGLHVEPVGARPRYPRRGR